MSLYACVHIIITYVCAYKAVCGVREATTYIDTLRFLPQYNMADFSRIIIYCVLD